MTVRTLSKRFAVLSVIGFAFIAAVPAHAAFYFSMDYWVTEVPSACVAVDPADLGSYVRQYREPTNQCPGLDVYHVVHGARTHPWSTESPYVKDGYLWQMMELFQSEQRGQNRYLVDCNVAVECTTRPP